MGAGQVLTELTDVIQAQCPSFLNLTELKDLMEFKTYVFIGIFIK